MAGRPGRKKRTETRHAADASALAALIRDMRLRLDITQEQLAARANVAVSTVRKIEQGQVVEPGYFTIKDIGQALGLSLALVEVDS